MEGILGPGDVKAPPAGYVQAWRIFIGTKVDGKMHFLCHIAENYSTAKAYNSGDFQTSKCPILLFGGPFHMKQSDMDSMRARFPMQHQGKVPAQMCFSVSFKRHSLQFVPYTSFSDIFQGSCEELITSNFSAHVMKPVGMQSLSFNSPDTPLEFWTHSSRSVVIHTALEKELNSGSPNGDKITVFQEGCNLEAIFSAAEKSEKEGEKKCQQRAKTRACKAKNR